MLFGIQKISRKLPLALVGSAIVVAAGVGVTSYLLASMALSAQARQNLATVAFERSNQLSAHLEAMAADLQKAAKGASSSLNGFAKAWISIDRAEGGPGAKAVLQGAFVVGAPEQRVDIDKVKGLAPTYAITHSMTQPQFREQVRARGYFDLYLFDTEGHLVYTVAKLDDFATSFRDGEGPFAETALGRLYEATLNSADAEVVHFADFARYPPAGDIPLAFLAIPVLDQTKAKVGVLAVSFAADGLSASINHRQGLGNTGETIIVGNDGLARSDSLFTPQNDVLAPSVFNATIEAVLAGTAADTDATLNGQDVVAAAAPVRVADDTSWALVATMNKDEIFAPVRTLTTLMALVGLALLALVALAGWFFSRSLTKPITRLTEAMNALAKGDLEVQVTGAHKSDELGEMARAVEVFKDNARQVNEMADRDRRASEQRRVDRTAMMQELQAAFGVVVDASVRGDFSRRVSSEFSDPELNTLAASVNSLVETVDRGLKETGAVLSSLANANLTMRVNTDYEGAFGELRDDTNRVGERLSEIILGLRETSSQLKSSLAEIASGSDDLSIRTNKQSAAVEETTAALFQLERTIHQNAERAESASSKAYEVSASASEGGTVMARATEAMERILQSSNEIFNIIGLIDDIAFQTNLLALNASVEAARAGDAGQGFAVVAVEVRRLAQSAAQASASVKRLIEQSSDQVKGGTNLVQEAAQRLVQIEDSAQQSSTLIESIAQASRDQAQSIGDVARAMRTIDEMTQHNAALVEETNAAIEQTNSQSEELDRVVDIFSVGGQGSSDFSGAAAERTAVAEYRPRLVRR